MVNHRMQRNRLILTASIFLSLLLADTALATPSFSRQINADCRTCHFQNMHALNKFGRAFKANAFNLTERMKKELNRLRKHKNASTQKG